MRPLERGAWPRFSTLGHGTGTELLSQCLLITTSSFHFRRRFVHEQRGALLAWESEDFTPREVCIVINSDISQHSITFYFLGLRSILRRRQYLLHFFFSQEGQRVR